MNVCVLWDYECGWRERGKDSRYVESSTHWIPSNQNAEDWLAKDARGNRHRAKIALKPPTTVRTLVAMASMTRLCAFGP